MSELTEFTAVKLASIDRAAQDPQLSHLDFRLLWLFSSAADRQTGIARRKQLDLAEILGVHRRTVQRCRDRLVSFRYLEPIGGKPGGYVSAYNILASKKATPTPPIPGKATPTPPFGGDKAAPTPPTGGTGVPKRRSHDRTNTSLVSPLRILPCATADTEQGGPRLRADALDPLGPRLRQRVGADAFQAWFVRGEAEIVSQTADTVRIAARSKFFAQEIGNRFEADLVACLGVPRIEFVVKEAGKETPRP